MAAKIPDELDLSSIDAPIPGVRARRAPAEPKRPRAPLPRRVPELLVWSWARIRRFPLTAIGAVAVLAFMIAFVSFVRGSGYFDVQDVQVTGLNRVTRKNVDAVVAEATLGSALATTGDLRRLEESLRAIPQVREVHVRRDWPNRLSIHVAEYEPWAVLLHSAGSFLVSKEGVIIDSAKFSDIRATPGPAISGLDSFQPAPGHAIAAGLWEKIVRVRLATESAAPIVFQKLSEIHCDEKNGLTLVMQTGTRALIGWSPLPESGPAFEAFLAQAKSSPEDTASVDLRTSTHLSWKPRPSEDPAIQTVASKSPAHR